MARPALPLRLRELESRIAPAIISRGDRYFTDSEILVKLISPDPLFHLTGRVVADRLTDIDLAGSELLYRRESETTGVVLAKLRAGADPEAVAAQLRGRPGVEFAEVNHVVMGDAREWVPNDPLYATPGQWHISKMQVDKAWDITKGSPGVVVAVLDDGLPTATQHEDLKLNRWLNDDVTSVAGDDDFNGYVNDTFGWDFIDDDRIPDPVGAASHGTQIAGIIAATSNNGKGVAGVAGGDSTTQGVRLMSVRIYGGSLDAATLSKGLHYAADNGAKIINLSYNIDDFIANQTFLDALDHAYADTKSLIFVSAGNNNTSTAARSVLTQALFVANTQINDERFVDPSYGSNYGSWVDISAPGTGIVTTLTFDDGSQTQAYQTDTSAIPLTTGTSFAAPNAAGVAALIWSKNPTWTRDQVAAQILGTADNIDNIGPNGVGQMGTGRVNAYRALTETLKAPQVLGIDELPGNSSFASELKTLTIRTTARVLPASVKASSFELRGNGPDGVFDTTDDRIIALTPAPYRVGSNSIDFAVEGMPLDQYRLTVRSGASGLRDPFGVALDGDGDGKAGGDWIRTFYASGSNLVTDEFRVNTYTTSDQSAASVAMDSNGQAIVTWTSNQQDGSGNGIFGQRFDANGAKVGNEFQINSYVNNHQEYPAVAVDGKGQSTVAWASEQGTIYAQRFDANGEKTGGQFQVNAAGPGLRWTPSVASAANGNTTIVWQRYLSGVNTWDIFASAYDASGSLLYGDYPVNSHISGVQTEPHVAADADGDVIVVWQSDDDAYFLQSGVYARVIPATGPVGGPFLVSNQNSGQTSPSVAMDAAGNSLIVWQSSGQDGSGHSIFGRRLAANGSWLSGQFQINTFTTGNQSRPSVAMDADGSAIVVWHSDGQDGLGTTSVYGQKFDPAGNKVGGEFQINTSLVGQQNYPAVATDSKGGAFVVWQDDTQDGNSWGVYGRRFGAGASSPVVLSQLRTNSGVTVANESQVLATVNGLVAGFDLPINVASGISASNWQLTRDGSPVAISGMTYDYNPQTKLNEVTIGLASALSPGDYVLTAKQAILDTLGNPIDGDGDGVPSGDFVRAFSVVTLVPLGAEFRVNATTAGHQRRPRLGVAADGTAVVSWHSASADGSSQGVVAQRLNAAGNAIGGEFPVNTYTTDAQQNLAIAVAPAGDFVVTWESEGQDGSGFGVFAQRFAADGSKIGGEFIVNTQTAGNQNAAEIAMDQDGDFVITWVGYDSSGFGVFAQQFASDGSKVGGEFQVNTAKFDRQDAPIIAMDPDGDFVIAWQTNQTDGGNNWGIHAQRFSAAGNKLGAEFPVHTYTTDHQQLPFVAMHSDGQFVITWRSPGQDGSGQGVYGQRFTSDGMKSGPEFLINTFTTGDQESRSMAFDASGNLLVNWVSRDQDGSGGGIYGQWFLPDGQKHGTEFRVNTFTANNQYSASVAHGAGGSTLVAWESFNQDGSGYGIYAQRFGPNPAPAVVSVAPITFFEDTIGFGNIFDIFQDPNQDDATLTYTLGSVSPAGLVSAVFNVNEKLSVTPVLDAFGSGSITIKATDAYGLWAEATIPIQVLPRNDRPTFTRGSDLTIPVNFVEQTYTNWASNIAAGPANESTQSVSFEIVGNTRPDLFTKLQLLPNGTLVVDPTDELYGAAVIQVRAKDDGGTADGGLDVSLVETFTITIVPDFLFGFAGKEALANSTKAGTQNLSAVALDGVGNVVVAWAGAGPGDPDGIFGQRYDRQGKTVGGEFRINTNTVGIQSTPSIAATSDGQFVVVWAGSSPSDPDGVFGQRFAADGTPLGAEFLINSTTTGKQYLPHVAVDLAGNFVVAWDDLTGADSRVRTQRFDAAGTKLGGETVVTTVPIVNPLAPRVGVAADGRHVVAWGEGDIFYRRFDATGSSLDATPQRANAHTTGSQTTPTIAVELDGDFVIAWQGERAGDFAGIAARRFAADGKAKDVADLVVNATTTGTQSTPRISMDVDGDFAITWAGYGQSDADGVYVRRYFADGSSPDAKGLRANSVVTGSQNSPAISMDHDGEFVVSWTSAGQDGDGDGVYWQRVGYPLPPLQTQTIPDPVVDEDAVDTTYDLFTYFSSSSGKSEAMDYTVFSVTNPSLFAPGYPQINPTTGRLTLRYAPNKSGNSSINVRVRDTTEVPTLTTIKVTVRSVNDAPQLAPISNFSVAEGSLLAFTALGSDPDDSPANALTYSLDAGAPVGASIHSTTGQFTWTPPDNLAGPAEITVRITDDGGTANGGVNTATRTFTVTINNVAPSAASLSGPASVPANDPAQFSLLNVLDAPGDLPTLKYSFDWTADGVYDLVDATSPTQSHTYNTPGVYTVRARVSDKDGGAAEYTTNITVTSSAPAGPKVQGVTLNDGGAQRSRVSSLTVVFNLPVDFTGNPIDAFELSRQGGDTVNIAGIELTGNTAKLTFSGPTTQAGSLIDGRYTLIVRADRVSSGGVALDGNGDGTAGDDHVLVGTPANGLFRLFGDADGSGQVGSNDFLAFRIAFLSSNADFDLDGNGSVDPGDFLQFRLRFLQNV